MTLLLSAPSSHQMEFPQDVFLHIVSYCYRNWCFASRMQSAMISNLIWAVTVPNQVYRFDCTLYRLLHNIRCHNRESMHAPQLTIEWWGSNESFRSHRLHRTPLWCANPLPTNAINAFFSNTCSTGHSRLLGVQKE